LNSVDKLRFYMDESVELAVSEQLAASGMDVVSAHSLGVLGISDIEHLQKALAMTRVLCTYDDDFLRLAKDGYTHAGIAYFPSKNASIGAWVKSLRELQTRYTSDNVNGQVIFLPIK